MAAHASSARGSSATRAAVGQDLREHDGDHEAGEVLLDGAGGEQDAGDALPVEEEVQLDAEHDLQKGEEVHAVETLQGEEDVPRDAEDDLQKDEGVHERCCQAWEHQPLARLLPSGVRA